MWALHGLWFHCLANTLLLLNPTCTKALQEEVWEEGNGGNLTRPGRKLFCPSLFSKWHCSISTLEQIFPWSHKTAEEEAHKYTQENFAKHWATTTPTNTHTAAHPHFIQWAVTFCDAKLTHSHTRLTIMQGPYNKNTWILHKSNIHNLAFGCMIFFMNVPPYRSCCAYFFGGTGNWNSYPSFNCLEQPNNELRWWLSVVLPRWRCVRVFNKIVKWR